MSLSVLAKSTSTKPHAKTIPASLGEARQTLRAFAGDPVYFYEPFGAVLPGLAHQEVGLLQREYLKGEARDGAG